MMKKLIAITLCLALTLLACACAASNVTVSAPESTDNKGESSTDLSTMEQAGTSTPVTPMSSQPEPSDENSKPTEPILPEERETTLEKVLSCQVGTNGTFEYGFTFYDDPSTAILEIGGQMYTDGNGMFYKVYRGSEIVCINSNQKIPHLHKGQVLDIAICGNAFYVLTGEGNVYEYDIANGLAKAILVKEYAIFEKHTEYAHFGHIVNGRPTVQYYAQDGTFWYPDGPYYTLEKEKLQDSESLLYVYVESPQDGAPLQAVNGEFKGWAVDKDVYTVVHATSESITLCENDSDQDIGVLVTYDTNGNLLSRYGTLYRSREYERKSCERPFEQGGSHILKEYLSYKYTIDNIVFEDIVWHESFVASDGNHYFVAYYLDHCDIYRINPGYSDRDYAAEWQE